MLLYEMLKTDSPVSIHQCILGCNTFHAHLICTKTCNFSVQFECHLLLHFCCLPKKWFSKGMEKETFGKRNKIDFVFKRYCHSVMTIFCTSFQF